MKSILEILAVGATLAALATVADAATPNANPKVNVGIATPRDLSPAQCMQQAAPSTTTHRAQETDAELGCDHVPKPDANRVNDAQKSRP